MKTYYFRNFFTGSIFRVVTRISPINLEKIANDEGWIFIHPSEIKIKDPIYEIKITRKGNKYVQDIHSICTINW